MLSVVEFLLSVVAAVLRLGGLTLAGCLEFVLVGVRRFLRWYGCGIVESPLVVLRMCWVVFDV